jgi:flagellar hook-basal body complex protein FliE
MDPLSTLRSVFASGIQGNLPTPGAASPKPIPLSELEQLDPANFTKPTDVAQPAAPGNFSNLLGDFVNEVSQKQAAAGDAVNGLLSGKNVSLHQAMISMEEASVSFQMMVEVRNKLLDSYQELMRMQI